MKDTICLSQHITFFFIKHYFHQKAKSNYFCQREQPSGTAIEGLPILLLAKNYSMQRIEFAFQLHAIQLRRCTFELQPHNNNGAVHQEPLSRKIASGFARFMKLIKFSALRTKLRSTCVCTGSLLAFIIRFNYQGKNFGRARVLYHILRLSRIAYSACSV